MRVVRGRTARVRRAAGAMVGDRAGAPGPVATAARADAAPSAASSGAPAPRCGAEPSRGCTRRAGSTEGVTWCRAASVVTPRNVAPVGNRTARREGQHRVNSARRTVRRAPVRARVSVVGTCAGCASRAPGPDVEWRPSSERVPLRVVTGGQSGVDRAATDVAIAHGVPYGGGCRRGGWAEDHVVAPGRARAVPRVLRVAVGGPRGAHRAQRGRGRRQLLLVLDDALLARHARSPASARARGPRGPSAVVTSSRRPRATRGSRSWPSLRRTHAQRRRAEGERAARGLRRGARLPRAQRRRAVRARAVTTGPRSSARATGERDRRVRREVRARPCTHAARLDLLCRGAAHRHRQLVLDDRRPPRVARRRGDPSP